MEQKPRRDRVCHISYFVSRLKSRITQVHSLLCFRFWSSAKLQFFLYCRFVFVSSFDASCDVLAGYIEPRSSWKDKILSTFFLPNRGFRVWRESRTHVQGSKSFSKFSCFHVGYVVARLVTLQSSFQNLHTLGAFIFELLWVRMELIKSCSFRCNFFTVSMSFSVDALFLLAMSI